jgi:hypothetical protein
MGDQSEEDLRLRERLQQAVRKEPAPPFLEQRIRREIQRLEHPAPPWRPWLMALAACGLLFLGVFAAYQRGYLRYSNESQDAYVASVSDRVTPILRVGLRDHIHCAVFRKYPKNLPSVDQMAQHMRPAHRGLLQVVSSRVPGNYRVAMAHQCSYHGRMFLHIALRDGSRVMSVVVAERQPGESMGASELAPALVEAALPLYAADAERFQIGAFESQKHLVYVISEMSREENLRLTAALSPAVREFLAGLENS